MTLNANMAKRFFSAARRLYENSSLPNQTIPFFIVGLGFLGLGLLTLNLGFFQDDWHHVYYLNRIGSDGLGRFLLIDGRPFASIIYDAFFGILGSKPLGWHLLILVLRISTALLFLQILNTIWETSVNQNAIIALLFLFYPVFLLQPLSVAYSLHWSMYLAYMGSILLMLRATHRTRWHTILTGASLLLQVFHLIMIEYYIGIELLRPVFLWCIKRELPRPNRIRLTLLAWLPYLFVDLLYIVYRASFSRIFGYERFSDMTFFSLLSQPLSLIAFYLQAGFQDITEILFSSWYATLQPGLFHFSSPARVLIWLGVAAVVFVSWMYFHLHAKANPSIPDDDAWSIQILLVGLLAVLFGILPGWIIGKTVFGSNPLWNDRIALASMFGAAMTWVGIVRLLITRGGYRNLLLAIMLGLAIGLNVHTQLDFKNSWEKQQDFYWQLHWRAPYIEPNTLLISDGEFLSYMGSYPSTFALNTIYPQPVGGDSLQYWLSNNQEHLPPWDEFREGTPLQFTKYASTFTGNTRDSISISFLPEEGQCLWVLPSEYANLRLLSPGIRETVPVSSIGRIALKALPYTTLPEDLLGPQPSPDWCYYFEKADLAAQYEDWDTVISLWDAAHEHQLGPRHGLELFPFIRANAMMSKWQQAFELTIISARISLRMHPAVCDLWNGLRSRTSDSALRQDAFLELNDRFSCGL